MAYAPDPGLKFASDVHRRVLGHLTTPQDNYGWSNSALLERLRPDLHPDFGQSELDTLLAEFKAEGLASDNGAGVWRMTDKGYQAITEQPGETAGGEGTASIGAATPLGEHTPEPANQAGAASTLQTEAQPNE